MLYHRIKLTRISANNSSLEIDHLWITAEELREIVATKPVDLDRCRLTLYNHRTGTEAGRILFRELQNRFGGAKLAWVRDGFFEGD